MVQTTYSPKVVAEMDNAWQHFLQHKVNSFIKWDLVRFFHDNPHTVDTAEHIARYVGRDAKTIERELNGLVQAAVLETETRDGQAIYRFSSQAETRQLIKDFVTACHNREFRVKAIHHVIQGMSFSPGHDF